MNTEGGTKIKVTYQEDTVIIFVYEPDFQVLVLDYDAFEELAYQVRQSPYGK